MLHTKFQTCGLSGSKEEYISMHFHGLNLGPPGAEPSSNLGPSFIQNWYRTTRQCYILNFKHLSQEVLKEKLFEYFSMYFYDLHLGPPDAGPSWTLEPSFEQTW